MWTRGKKRRCRALIVGKRNREEKESGVTCSFLMRMDNVTLVYES